MVRSSKIKLASAKSVSSNATYIKEIAKPNSTMVSPPNEVAKPWISSFCFYRAKAANCSQWGDNCCTKILIIGLLVCEK